MSSLPHNGSLPHNAKAVIALTSWKARINTVGITIFNLLHKCPGFHIVLTLSIDEFPRKFADLPKDLVTLYKANLFEILWTQANIKSMKKICFAMQKYPTVPIISADDDCIYKYNYAEELYNIWCRHKQCIITYKKAEHYGIPFQHGPATIYPPSFLSSRAISLCTSKPMVAINHDDVFYGLIAWYSRVNIIEVNKPVPYIFHDTNDALSSTRSIKCHKAIRLIMDLIKKVLL